MGAVRLKIACVAMLMAGVATAASARDLTVVSFGGSLQDAIRAAFITPFVDGGGAKVIEDTYDGALSKITAQVETGATKWDVIDVESNQLLQGCQEGAFEQLSDQRLLIDLPFSFFQFYRFRRDAARPCLLQQNLAQHQRSRRRLPGPAGLAARHRMVLGFGGDRPGCNGDAVDGDGNRTIGAIEDPHSPGSMRGSVCCRGSGASPVRAGFAPRRERTIW